MPKLLLKALLTARPNPSARRLGISKLGACANVRLLPAVRAEHRMELSAAPGAPQRGMTRAFW